MQKVIGNFIIILLLIGGCSQQKKERQYAKKTGNTKDERETVKNKKKNTDGLVVVMETSMGSIEIELNENKAPVTVKNFLSYVTSGTYDGTIFHRVMDGFMIQGGGFTPDGNKKPTNPPIELESNNGLTNNLGTIAMARTNIPDSATNQFFINVKDNNFLNYSPASPGYTVFGKVVSGMDIVKQIKKVETGTRGGMKDWPVDDVLIKKVFLKK